MMRKSLLLFSFFGFLFFGCAFVVSFFNPLLVERTARELLRLEVEREVGERIDSLSNSKLVTFAQRAIGRTEQEIETTRRALHADIPRGVANVMANMLNADCECRKRLAQLARLAETAGLESLTQLRETLGAFVESKYATVATQLMREFRIFTGSNTVAFALLGAITYFRRRAALPMAAPAIVLGGAIVVVGYLYLFQQDWLQTILFSQYAGFGYVGYMGAVACLLGDIVFNRGHITTVLVEVVVGLVSTATKGIWC